jgi:hypothetical protein
LLGFSAHALDCLTEIRSLAFSTTSMQSDSTLLLSSIDTITVLDSDPRVGSIWGYVLALDGRPTIFLTEKLKHMNNQPKSD